MASISAYHPPFLVLVVGKCRALTPLLERMVSARPQVELRTGLPDGTGVCACEGQVPDLIFVDADSPDYSAALLCQSFKHNLETRTVPLIVVSASEKACEGALELGADDFVTPQTLLALQFRRIAALVQVRQARQFLLLEEDGEPPFPPLQWGGRVVSENPRSGIQFDHQPSVCTPAVVLFADLRGYSHICECLEPRQVVLLLQEYFSLITQITLEHQGTVFHTAGDCVMAGFGISTERSDAADRALHAAQMMMSRFVKLAASWLLRFEVTAGLGVGLNTGEVAVAQTGPPLATRSTLIGDTVNVAARLCQRARAGEIVLSAEFKETLGNHEAKSGIAALSQVVVPGRAKPVDIFCLPIEHRGIPLQSSISATSKHHRLGLGVLSRTICASPVRR
jgi:adenylate cyclase